MTAASPVSLLLVGSIEIFLHFTKFALNQILDPKMSRDLMAWQMPVWWSRDGNAWPVLFFVVSVAAAMCNVGNYT